jgi:hypothetical protein
MWLLLSDPRHSAYCLQLGAPRLTILGQLLSELQSRPYATSVYGHFSHDLFIIGTAPSYQEADNSSHRRILGILPRGEVFRVGYGATPESNWGWDNVDGSMQEVGSWEACTTAEALALIDRIVPRDLLVFIAKDTRK